MARLLCLAALACVPVLLLSPAVHADDLAPPPYRGEPHSVLAKFDLFGGTQPGPPDQFNAVGGIYPLDPLTPGIGAGMFDPTRNAITYPVFLPNFIDPLPLKRIRVQYSWFGNPTGPIGDAMTDAILPSPGGAVQLVGGTPPVLVPGSGNVFHRWDDYEIIPNPDSERFEISFINADPRWIVIDTISIPEPSAVVLGGLVAMLAVAQRR